MTKGTRTLGRIVAMQELTPEQLEKVSAGGPFEDMTFNASPDSCCQGVADDCTADG